MKFTAILFAVLSFIVNFLKYCNFCHYLLRNMAKSDINEIKLIIRGLLISSPHEINVGKLRHDYKQQEGCDIPFYEFGFHDITSFLRSIPDVCQVNSNEYGPFAIVRLVESDKSAHVSSLVCRQKLTLIKGRRRAIRGRFPPVSNRHHSVSNRHHSVSNSFKVARKFTTKTVNSDCIFGEYNQTSQSFPEREESYMCSKKSDCTDFPSYDSSISLHNGCVKTEENYSSKNLEKNEECVEENSLCVSDTSANDYTELPAFIDLHLRQRITDSKGVHVDEVAEHLKDSLLTRFDSDNHLDNVVQIMKTIPNLKIENDHVHLSQPPYDKKSSEVSSNVEADNISHESGEILEDPHKSHIIKTDLRVTADVFVPSGKNEKVQRLERNLFSLMKDYSHGILGSELREKYKMKFAAPLNFQILGCKSVWDLANNMSHIFNTVCLEDGSFKLFPVWYPRGQTFNESKSVLNETRKKTFIPALTKRNVEWLMQGYPDGLLAKNFEETYKDTFLGGIDLKEMGFLSIDEFLYTLEELNVLQIQNTETDNWLLPSPDSRGFTIDEDALPLNTMDNKDDIGILKEKFPSDVVGPDTHVHQVEIPSEIKKGSDLGVFVQEINNPHNFWITFYGPQYTNALNSLMDDLQAFYCTKSHSYRMPPDVMREGQDCVTQYVGEWHRARIKQIVSAAEVEVCFYDYGTQKVVPRDNVHYLLTAHSALPAQAVRAALANIAPVKDKWTQESSKRFLQLIADKPLYAIVKTVDRINKVFSLFLCDTLGTSDIYIHEVLVSEGFAVRSLNKTSKKESQKIEAEQLELETDQKSILLNTPESTVPNVDFSTREHCVSSSDHVQETVSQNLSPLPHALAKDGIPLASPTFITSQCDSDSMSHVSINSKMTGDSVASSQQVATSSDLFIASKNEVENNDCDDETLSSAFTNMSAHDKNINIEEEIKTPKECFVNALDMENMHDHNNGKNTGISTSNDDERPAKGVNTEVNANVPAGFKSSYVPNANACPSWSPVSSYSQFSSFPPPFGSLNMNTAFPPLPLSPFPLSPLPNPLDLYSLWYYEQWRQHAFLQGILTQQATCSTVPSLPPGMFLPHTQPTLNSQILSQQTNQMNISELLSPDSSLKTQSDSRLSSASHKAESSTTQRGVLSTINNVCEMQKTSRSNSSVSAFPILATSVSAADTSVQTCPKDTVLDECLNKDDLCENNNKLLTSERKSDSLLQDTATDSGLFSNSEAIGICDQSETLLRVGQNLDNAKESNSNVSSSGASTCGQLNKISSFDLEPYVLESSFNTHFSGDSSPSKIKNVGHRSLDEEFYQRVHTVDTPLVHDSHDVSIENSAKHIPENGYFVLEDIEKKPSEISKISDKLEENVIVFNHATGDNGQRSLEKIEGKDFVVKASSSTPRENKEIETIEDDSCVQTHLIEKHQQESSLPVLPLENFTKSPVNLPVSTSVCNGSLIEGCRNLEGFTKSFPVCAAELTPSTEVSRLKKHTNKPVKFQRDCEIEKGDASVDVTELKILDECVNNEKLTSKLRFPVCDIKKSSLCLSDTNMLGGHQGKVSLSETLCSGSRSLSVGNVDLSSGIANQIKERNTRKLSAELNTHLPVTSNIVESSAVMPIAGGHRRTSDENDVCKDLLSLCERDDCDGAVFPRRTVLPASHNAQKKENHEFPSNSCRYDIPSNVKLGKTGPSADVHSTLSSFGASKEQHLNSVTSVHINSTTQKPCVTLCETGNLQAEDSTLQSQSSPQSWKPNWLPVRNGRHSLQKEISHDCTKNVSSSSGIRILPNQTTSYWHKESYQSTKQGKSQQFVKKIYLSNKKIHQINLDGRPYVLTEEIVNAFTPFNGRHVILKILEARKVEINFLDLSRKRRPEVFECLDKSDIDCINRGPTGNVIGSVHIVPLRSVPYLLRALNRDDTALSKEVMEEMDKFDTNDPYWSGHCN